MKYSSYTLRRQIMGDGAMPETTRFFALMIVEYVDWNSGCKTFASQQHFTNWIKALAEQHGVDIESLNRAVNAMRALDYATFDVASRTLTISQKPEWEDEVAGAR